MIKIIIFGLFILALFKPSTGGILFVTIIGLTNLILFALQHYKQRKSINSDLKEQLSFRENEILEKYHLYFKYPLTSKALSSTSSLVVLLSYILIAWFLWNQLWALAILVLINILLSGNISTKLNPRLFLHTEVEKRNNLELMDEMLTVDSICEKIDNHQIKNLEKNDKQ